MKIIRSNIARSSRGMLIGFVGGMVLNISAFFITAIPSMQDIWTSIHFQPSCIDGKWFGEIQNSKKKTLFVVLFTTNDSVIDGYVAVEKGTFDLAAREKLQIHGDIERKNIIFSSSQNIEGLGVSFKGKFIQTDGLSIIKGMWKKGQKSGVFNLTKAS